MGLTAVNNAKPATRRIFLGTPLDEKKKRDNLTGIVSVANHTGLFDLFVPELMHLMRSGAANKKPDNGICPF